jgi:sarcosine oxidase delta subunit
MSTPNRIRKTRRRPYFSKELAELQADLLATAERLWKKSSGCDTAVRDTVADGLARLVYVAYDCEGVNKGLGLSADDSFDAHREWSTEKWFKDHGCADWYAKGAATLFHTMRLPSFQFIQVSHRPRRKKTP